MRLFENPYAQTHAVEAAVPLRAEGNFEGVGVRGRQTFGYVDREHRVRLLEGHFSESAVGWNGPPETGS